MCRLCQSFGAIAGDSFRLGFDVSFAGPTASGGLHFLVVDGR